MKRLLVAGIALLSVSTNALAQEHRDLRVRIGAGAQLRPQYPGADTDKVGPLFSVSFAHGTDPFKVKGPDDSSGIDLVSTPRFSFGPAANFVGPRRDSDVGAPVGRVPPTVEVGVFAGFRPTPDWRVRGEVLKGIGGHDGFRAQLGVDRIWRDRDRYVFTVGPRLLIADVQYERAYFGVSPAAALRTGLPAYSPGGGIYGVAATSGVSFQLDQHFGLFGYARYERLVGDAARSPIVRRYGSRDQVSGGIGLSYTFTVKR